MRSSGWPNIDPRPLPWCAGSMRDDFAELGYSTDLDRLERQRPIARAATEPLRRWGMASRLLREGDFEQAARELEHACRWLYSPLIEKRRLACYLRLVERHENTEPEHAAQLMAQAIALSSSDHRLWKRYGRILAAAGQHEEALEALIQALIVLGAGPPSPTAAAEPAAALPCTAARVPAASQGCVSGTATRAGAGSGRTRPEPRPDPGHAGDRGPDGCPFGSFTAAMLIRVRASVDGQARADALQASNLDP